MTDHPTSEAVSAGERCVCGHAEHEHNDNALVCFDCEEQSRHEYSPEPVPASAGSVLTPYDCGHEDPRFAPRPCLYKPAIWCPGIRTGDHPIHAACACHDAAFRTQVDDEKARADKAEVERLTKWAGYSSANVEAHPRFAIETARADKAEAALDVARTAYQELLYEVGSKYPDETRHETARRYIREAEKRQFGDGIAGSALAAADGKGREG